jgi:pyruvate,water dikinase
MLIGSAHALDARAIVAERRAEREAATRIRPRNWVGTVTPSQLAFPYLVNWGYQERFTRELEAGEGASQDGRIAGIAGSPGVVEGTARVVMTVDQFDEVRDGGHPGLPDDEPGLGRALHEDRRLVTDTGGVTSHPAVLSREFGIPAVIGTSHATHRISTGDRLRVDGTNGVVEILAEPPAIRGVLRGTRPAAHRRPRHEPGRERPRGHGLPRLPARRRDDDDRADARRRRHRLGPGRGEVGGV